MKKALMIPAAVIAALVLMFAVLGPSSTAEPAPPPMPEEELLFEYHDFSSGDVENPLLAEWGGNSNWEEHSIPQFDPGTTKTLVEVNIKMWCNVRWFGFLECRSSRAGEWKCAVGWDSATEPAAGDLGDPGASEAAFELHIDYDNSGSDTWVKAYTKTLVDEVKWMYDTDGPDEDISRIADGYLDYKGTSGCMSATTTHLNKQKSRTWSDSTTKTLFTGTGYTDIATVVYSLGLAGMPGYRAWYWYDTDDILDWIVGDYTTESYITGTVTYTYTE